jgi:hypothetical protein
MHGLSCRSAQIANHFMTAPASRDEFGMLLEALGGFKVRGHVIDRTSVPAPPLRTNSADDFLGLAHASVAVASSAVTAAVVDAARPLWFCHGMARESTVQITSHKGNGTSCLGAALCCLVLLDHLRCPSFIFCHCLLLHALFRPCSSGRGNLAFSSGVLCCPLPSGWSRMLDNILVLGLTVHPCLCTPWHGNSNHSTIE